MSKRGRKVAVVLIILALAALVGAFLAPLIVEARGYYVVSCTPYYSQRDNQWAVKVTVWEKLANGSRNPYRWVVTHYLGLGYASRKSTWSTYYGVTFGKGWCSVW